MQLMDQGDRLLLKIAGAVIVVNGERADEVMLDTAHLLRGWSGRADRQLTEKLTGIGRENGRAEPLRHTQAQFRFSDSRRPQ